MVCFNRIYTYIYKFISYITYINTISTIENGKTIKKKNENNNAITVQSNYKKNKPNAKKKQYPLTLKTIHEDKVFDDDNYYFYDDRDRNPNCEWDQECDWGWFIVLDDLQNK